MISRKFLMQTTKWSTSPTPHGSRFNMLGQNQNAYNLYIVGKKILSGLILSKNFGPKMDRFRAIDRKPKRYILKSFRFFVKNCQDMKK